MNLVPGRKPAQEAGAVTAKLLRHRQDRRDVVAGMAVVGGEEGVVHVQLAHRGAVGPGCPFRAYAHAPIHAEHRGTRATRGGGMRQRHVPRRHARMPVDARDRDRCVVDHAVDDHLRRLGRDRHRIDRDARDLPGQLFVAP